MDIHINYVVYELNSILGSKEHRALQKVEFSNWKTNNSFKTEEEAIQALVDDNKTYNDYVILKEVYIN